MTQPKLSAFFTSSSSTKSTPDPAALSEAGAPKRALDSSGGGVEGDCGTPAVQAPAAKKMAVEKSTMSTASSFSSFSPSPFSSASSSSASASTPSFLSSTLVPHPVLQSLPIMDDGWRQLVTNEANKPYFKRLLAFLTQEATSKQVVYPPYPLVFTALTLCRWTDVRVVIIGQDPYHGPNQAHGLAFSVVGPTPPPPSLNNMFKEAVMDVVGFIKPSHGNLEAWSRQGVLLLNTVLTVRRGQAHSHKGKGWESFTDAVIKELDAKKTGLVFLLWGKPAQEKCKNINRKKHRVIQCAHPSPLSATKTSTPFIGSKSFSRANLLLKELGKAPIDWRL